MGCRVADIGLDGHGATTRQVPGQAGVPLKALERLGPVGLAGNPCPFWLLDWGESLKGLLVWASHHSLHWTTV